MLLKSHASNKILWLTFSLFFDNFVDLIKLICHVIDSANIDMTIFDSSGIDVFVTENNPTYIFLQQRLYNLTS